jgi:hypothetical protein
MKRAMKLSTAIPSSSILFALALLALVPVAEAVSPVRDGGYPYFNTADGQSALFSLTTGSANTAVGWFSLKNDTDGSFNTGVSAGRSFSTSETQVGALE